MSFKHYRLLKKHFRVTKLSELPDKSSLEYHPLQNILKGTEHLRQKSNALWTSRKKKCIDEGRVTSKNKRNQFKIRNPDKPVRMGWIINKLAEVGEKGGSFVSNHIVKVGKATYTDVSKGKTYNMVKLRLTDVKPRTFRCSFWFFVGNPQKTKTSNKKP